LLYSNPGADNNSTALRSLVGGIQQNYRLQTGYVPKSRELNQLRRSHTNFYKSRIHTPNKIINDIASQYRHNERLSETASGFGAKHSRSTNRLTTARIED